MPNQIKLDELRARTDRDLLLVIERELDRGIALASVAATKGSPLHTQAEQTYRRAISLLLKAEKSQRERVQFEARLKEFRLLLDDAPAVAEMVRDGVQLASGD